MKLVFIQLGEIYLSSILLNSFKGCLILDKHSLTSCLVNKVTDHIEGTITVETGNIHQHDISFLILDSINVKCILFVTLSLSNVFNENIKSTRFKCNTRLEHLDTTIIDFLVGCRHDNLERLIRDFYFRFLIRNITVTDSKVSTISRCIMQKLID